MQSASFNLQQLRLRCRAWAMLRDTERLHVVEQARTETEVHRARRAHSSQTAASITAPSRSAPLLLFKYHQEHAFFH